MKKISSVKSVLNIFTKKSKRLFTTTTVIGFIIFLLIIAALIFGISRQQKVNANSCASEKGLHIIAETENNLRDYESGNLSTAIEMVKQFSDHEENVDCLYILTKYYITVTNIEEAKKYYALLQERYDPEEGFSDALSAGEFEYNELGKGMEFLKKIEDEMKHNSEIFKGIE